MGLGPVQRELFGSFPRRLGTPSQDWVFNEAQAAEFVHACQGRYNLYASLGRLPLTVQSGAVYCQPECDKVLFDLDGDKRAFPADVTDDAERVQLLRQDPDLADAVLGGVVADARELARASHDDGIPVVGVFSGMGVHVHQLYQPREEPKAAMGTCAAKYIEELNLQTADWAVTGEPERICRLPNAERVTMNNREYEVREGRPTGLYQVPIAGEELRSLTVQWLLDHSTSPRRPSPLYTRDRPQMPTWEAYRDTVRGVDADTDEDVTARPVDEPLAAVGETGVKDLLADLLRMPCMYERIVQPNPEHAVRLNCAVLLFNVGLTPDDVASLYASLNWIDYDRQTTEKHLQSIWKNRYPDMSCRTIRHEKKLCTRTEDPESCPCFGWAGGQPEYPTETET